MKKSGAIAVISIIIVALLGLSARWVYRRYWSEEIVPSQQLYPVRGIDLSSHNGAVDFGRVHASGIDFVMLKASEGTSFRDNRFEDNYIAAREGGLQVGAYHFFRFDRDGRLQAEHFLQTVGTRHLDFPLVLDVEKAGNSSTATRDEIFTELSKAIRHLTLRGRQVMIYTNKDGYREWIKGLDDSIPLWICSFTDPPLPGNDSWYMWQYTHRGQVDGVDGKVDLNVLNPSARKEPALICP